MLESRQLIAEINFTLARQARRNGAARQAITMAGGAILSSNHSLATLFQSSIGKDIFVPMWCLAREIRRQHLNLRAVQPRRDWTHLYTVPPPIGESMQLCLDIRCR